MPLTPSCILSNKKKDKADVSATFTREEAVGPYWPGEEEKCKVPALEPRAVR